MNRRTGPGGRLRPAPRSHRPASAPIESAARPVASGKQAEAVVGHDSDPAWLTDPSVAVEEDDQSGPMVDQDALTSHEVESNNAASFAASTVVVDAPAKAVGSAEPSSSIVPNRRSSAPDLSRPQPRGMAPSAASEGRPEPPTAERSEVALGCTSPQLRRFIKSRAYVPLHELRRRFGIEGEDDDVSPIDVKATRIFAGLPSFESRLLGDLIRNGEIGYELSLDPETPIVIGVYSMRPVSRT